MTTQDGSAAAQPPPQQVDVEKLAEKVYRLMLAELRLERARTGGGPPRR